MILRRKKETTTKGKKYTKKQSKTTKIKSVMAAELGMEFRIYEERLHGESWQIFFHAPAPSLPSAKVNGICGGVRQISMYLLQK
jgi:hypothetical protein